MARRVGRAFPSQSYAPWHDALVGKHKPRRPPPGARSNAARNKRYCCCAVVATPPPLVRCPKAALGVLLLALVPRGLVEAVLEQRPRKLHQQVLVRAVPLGGRLCRELPEAQLRAVLEGVDELLERDLNRSLVRALLVPCGKEMSVKPIQGSSQDGRA